MMKKLRQWIWIGLKSILFRLDAETVHLASVRWMRWSFRWFGTAPFRIVCGDPTNQSLPSTVFEMPFLSPVGLAAGFDKNAELLEILPSLGFGFAEIGTVTLRPQLGNPRPRLFRDASQGAIFNRMGFNSDGAQVVSARLKEVRSRGSLPSHFRVGVNLGKNKETTLEEAAKDYFEAAQYFEGLADYLVINVSSPNTPGLRSLQTEQALQPIVGGVMKVISKWRKSPPLLLKLAPELDPLELKSLIFAGDRWGVAGWVLTNTLGGTFPYKEQSLTGGWSGKPLAELSGKCLVEAKKLTKKPIISVGGIFSIEDGMSRLEGGASLIQVYTGWIYGGPSFAVELTEALAQKQKP